MARFKDKALDATYHNLVGNTPEQLMERHIYGSLLAAFRQGYNRETMCHAIPRNTFAYAAYVAGKETPVRL